MRPFKTASLRAPQREHLGPVAIAELALNDTKHMLDFRAHLAQLMIEGAAGGPSACRPIWPSPSPPRAPAAYAARYFASLDAQHHGDRKRSTAAGTDNLATLVERCRDITQNQGGALTKTSHNQYGSPSTPSSCISRLVSARSSNTSSAGHSTAASADGRRAAGPIASDLSSAPVPHDLPATRLDWRPTDACAARRSAS